MPRHPPSASLESRVMAKRALEKARAFVVAVLPTNRRHGELYVDAESRADLRELVNLFRERFQNAVVTEHAILGCKALKRGARP